MTQKIQSLIGKTIRGYEFQELLGVGGMGAVFRAHQAIVARDVAIKVILPDLANKPEYIRQFETEAQLVARLEHPFIVPLFDFWRDPSGAFFVTRLFREGSLRTLLDEENQLDLQDISRLVEQISGALQVAHTKHVIHRDLKPENILLDSQHNFYLADFGIALQQKMAGSDAEHDDNDEDIFTGSPAYVPPEQIMSQALYPPTDLYSLGYILFEALTGEHAFKEEAITQMLMHHLNDELPISDTLTEQMNKFLQKATHKDMHQRHESALIFAEAFHQAIGLDDFSVNELQQISVRRNPYKGLRPFEEADAYDFYGREMQIEQLLWRFTMGKNEQQRFTCLVGPSGSGKSSLIQAGLIPMLRDGRIPNSNTWFYTDMLCSGNPINALASALLAVATTETEDIIGLLSTKVDGLVTVVNQLLTGDNTTELFLYIDQFEELFTSQTDETIIQQFLNLITYAVTAPNSRIRVVTTIRADFYDRPLAYEKFAGLISTGSEIVLPLSSVEIENIIVKPAESVGLTVESSLVAMLISDVREQIGALPLLQYALSELYEHSKGRVLSLDTYLEFGGINGVLTKRANEVYLALSNDDQMIAQRFLLQLINPGDGGPDTRRRVRWVDLLSLMPDRATFERIQETFVNSRLVTVDHDMSTHEPTLEIVHEALINEWGRLRFWIEENRSDLHQQRILQRLATDWQKNQQDVAFLLTGSRLTQFEDWRISTSLQLTNAETKFLDDSLKKHTDEIRKQQQQEVRERHLEHQSRNRLQTLLAVVGVAAVFGFILAVFAFGQSQIANDERDSRSTQQVIAETSAAEAKDNLVVAVTNESRAASAEATAVRSADESHSLLFAALAQDSLRNNQPNEALSFLLEANKIPQASVDVRRLLREAAYQQSIIRLVQIDQDLISVALSPDEKYLAVGTLSGEILIFEYDTLNQIDRLTQHHTNVNALAFISNHQLLSASDDSQVILWDIEHGLIENTFEAHEAPVNTIAISPEGNKFATGDKKGLVYVWDIESASKLLTIVAHDVAVNDIAFSPDGQLIATASDDKTVELWSATTGQSRQTLEGHDDWVFSVQFSPDGQSLISASFDDSMIEWDMSTGAILGRFNGHTDTVTDFSFIYGNKTLISASSDSSLRIWDIKTQDTLYTLKQHSEAITDITSSTDHRQVISVSSDGQIVVWSVFNDAQLLLLAPEHQSIITAVALIDDTNYAVSSGFDSKLILWDLSTGMAIDTVELDDFLASLTVNSSDNTIIGGGHDKNIYVWQLTDGQNPKLELLKQIEWDEEITVLHKLDDVQLLVADKLGTIHLVNWQSEARINTWASESTVTSLSIASDKKHFASVDTSGHVNVWELDNATAQFSTQADGLLGSVWYEDSNNRVWFGNAKGELTRWNLDDDSTQSFSQSNGAIWQILELPDGLLTISSDGQINLSDLNGQILYTYPNSSVGISSGDVNPDDTHFITGNDEGELIVWRIDRLDSLKQWIESNRYIPAIPCEKFGSVCEE